MIRQIFNIPPTISYTQEDGTKNTFVRNEELGRGSFAVVYRVTLQGTNENYAMKVVSKQILSGPKGKKIAEKLKNEIEIQGIVNHPNVVKSKCIFSDDSNYYFILEYCPGQNVRDYLKKSIDGRLTESETRKIIKDVLNGLVYIHSLDIVHYDIKLENFLLDKNGNVKIADFGLSIFHKNEEGKRFSLSGTPNYLSPEMLRREKRDESYKVDIWSVGISAYIMLTGKGPFEGPNKDKTFENIKSCVFSFPQKVEISEDAKEFIKEILKDEPSQRPTAKQLLNHPFITKSDKESVQLNKYNRLPQLFRDSQSPQKVRPIENNVLPQIKLNSIENASNKMNTNVSPRRHNLNVNKMQSPRFANLNNLQSPRMFNVNNSKPQTPRFSNANRPPQSPRILPSMNNNNNNSPKLSNLNGSKPQTPRLPSISRSPAPLTASGNRQQTNPRFSNSNANKQQAPRLLPSMDEKPKVGDNELNHNKQKVSIFANTKVNSNTNTKTRLNAYNNQSANTNTKSDLNTNTKSDLNTNTNSNTKTNLNTNTKSDLNTNSNTKANLNTNTKSDLSTNINSKTNNNNSNTNTKTNLNTNTNPSTNTNTEIKTKPHLPPRLPSINNNSQAPRIVTANKPQSPRQSNVVIGRLPLHPNENSHNANTSSTSDMKKTFSIPNYFISRYCFYNENLGYLLGDGTVGVCFKDSSRIVMDPNEKFVQYYKNLNSRPEVIKLGYETEKSERKQEDISLVKKAASNFKKIRFSFDLEKVDYDSSVPLHNVNCYVKNDDTILFKLNDKNIQVNFNDYKKMIIFWNTKKMCFFRNFKEKCSLLDMKYVASMSSNSDELKKYKKSKEMLSNLAITI